MNATLHQFVERYGPKAGEDGPVLLALEVFGATLEPGHTNTLDPWQLRTLRAYGRGERGISIKACHGPGKTWVVSVMVWHQLLCRFPQHASLWKWLVSGGPAGRPALKLIRWLACTDCGAPGPRLDWDHLPGFPHYGLSGAIQGLTAEKALAEIQKCEPVCRRCHNGRTRDRQVDPTAHDGAARPDLVDWVRHGVPLTIPVAA